MHSRNVRKIFFISPYPVGEAPGQRFRYEQYMSLLETRGFSIHFSPFLNSNTTHILYQSGKTVQKFLGVLAGFARRVALLFQVRTASYIFIFREMTPIGPPIFEWIISMILKKKVIYDFDDAIWLTDKTTESRIEKIFRWRRKVRDICCWSYKVSAGNGYLAEFAKRFASDVVVNPTTIDTERVHNPRLHEQQQKKEIIIGWTGSHSTLKYLKIVEESLQLIEKEFPQVIFWIIADKPASLKLSRMVFRQWSFETEISDLAQLDIGIMPLPDDEWTRGKCGFKALQYMSMGIPTVASPVGVNQSIISHNLNGFLATYPSEWWEFLSRLVKSQSLRQRLGNEGKNTVDLHYSVKSNAENFLSLFD